MKKYEIIEHTADIGLKAFGKNLNEIFENAALGMFNIISDTKKIEAIGEYKVILKTGELDQMLVDWLSQLLFLQDVQNSLFGKFEVQIEKSNEEYRLDANVYGEKFNPNKHPVGKEIKAVTYHLLEVNEKKGYAKVLFDI